jgi:hypothetical protein
MDGWMDDGQTDRQIDKIIWLFRLKLTQGTFPTKLAEVPGVLRMYVSVYPIYMYSYMN